WLFVACRNSTTATQDAGPVPSEAGTDAAAPIDAPDFDAGADVSEDATPDSAVDARDAGTGAGATIVPLYSLPTDPAWTAIIAAKKNHPTVDVVAIVNPDSGPGAAKDASYTDGIAALLGAGIRVIGYVHSSYTVRLIGDV